MYLHTLPDYPALKNKFAEAGYEIDVELSNELVIEKDGEFIDYDELPADLKEAINKFAEDNNLND